MTDTSLPIVRMRPNKSPQRVRFGFPWIYNDELVLDRRAKNIPAGDLVLVQDHDRRPVAVCAFNANSKITARVLALGDTFTLDQDWFVQKLRYAAQYRDRMFDKPFYRLIHAESDGMPGVIIDRFGDAFVVQPNAAWADTRMDMIAAALREVFNAAVIVKNATGRARTLEGLDEDTAVLHGAIDAPIATPMNNATYMADLLGGQKTGLFYDQRPNHAFAAKLAKDGDVLDVFSHVGGFSLAALAAGAKSALAVDASAPALELASAGANASGQGDQFSTERGDAFDVMAALAEAGRQFDLVVCDPPAFAPAKPALDKGLRAYERVARMGAALVKPGGFLVLCSCSHAADLAKFRTASLRGMGKSGRSGQIIHVGAAGADHPVHPHLAESSYLKSIFLRLN
ncbi:SAM-dependent methyltransferase [Amylibacter ulvae]|uniref:SAM-dependent methyltransferase n=1 Tax=Paramylibacter ulvae TaxID=1651968 RepID=A0ABQ3D520_9RHOB|nr:class I SAM-dependent rRNA methyltransferase [Amylibacter ulvae]GHA53192.1 SAM-dependent methyltransferase [Amylibacter ulvae]